MIFLNDDQSKAKRAAVKTILPKNFGYLYGVKPVHLEFDADGTPFPPKGAEFDPRVWNRLESGKLKLSHKMAAKISLQSGVSGNWLLNPKWKQPPVCERDPEREYTPEVFKMIRAEILDPRIEPLDVVGIEALVAAAYRRLCDTAWQAYRADRIVYFYYMLREFLRELDNHWKDSRKMPDSADVALLFTKFASLMEQTRIGKLKRLQPKKGS